MKCCKPDYSNCGLNIISSISREMGLPLSHPGHPLLEKWLKEKKYQNIILMLFDGMGVDILEKALPESAFLRKNLRMALSAVYPSTTPNATTCIECGVSPREHAWLGWTLYFKQIQKPVDIFINRSEGEIAADYPVAQTYIPREMIFPRITAAGQAEACCISPFGDTHIDTLDELFETALRLSQDEKRRYIYTYWGDPDHTMHEKGCYDEHIFSIIRDINDRVEKFAAQLPEDTLLLLTADHGLIDAKHHYLQDIPELVDMLVHYPTMESRAASFHVKPECVDQFPAVFRKYFPENFLLMTRDEFIRDYLGDGEIRPDVYDFVGDYMALATDHDCIDGKHKDYELKGVHAGLTEQEMKVPLIAYQK